MGRLYTKIALFDDYADEDNITRDFTDDEPTQLPREIEIWSDEPGTIVCPVPPPPR